MHRKRFPCTLSTNQSVRERSKCEQVWPSGKPLGWCVPCVCVRARAPQTTSTGRAPQTTSTSAPQATSTGRAAQTTSTSAPQTQTTSTGRAPQTASTSAPQTTSTGRAPQTASTSAPQTTPTASAPQTTSTDRLHKQLHRPPPLALHYHLTSAPHTTSIGQSSTDHLH